MPLTVIGTLGSPKIKGAKKATSYMNGRSPGQMVGGSIEIPLSISRPEIVGAPQPDYIVAQGEPEPFEPWTADEVKEEDTDWENAAKSAVDDEVKARNKKDKAAHTRRVKQFKEAVAEHAAEVKEWEDAQPAAAAEFMHYGNLAAMVTVFAGLECRISIEPTGDGMIPGFVDLMLPSPVEVAR